MTEYSMMWQDSSDFIGMMAAPGEGDATRRPDDTRTENEAEHECIEAITKSYE